MERRFEGKVALATGATTRIGQPTAVRLAAAVLLAAEGAVVGVNQRPEGDPGETLRRMGTISMLAKALGAHLGQHGIRVNAVEPGWVQTNMSAPMMDDPAAIQYYTEPIALHRAARPDELEATIAYLLSPGASYAACAPLLVDGGLIVNAEL